MFNKLSSYLFGSSAPEEEEPVIPSLAGNEPMSTDVTSPKCQVTETTEDEEWILVDKTSPEDSQERGTVSSSASSTPEFIHPASRGSPHTTASGLPSGDTSGDSDIGSDISTLPDNACSGETWLVTPPPCFTAGGTSQERIEQNPLENLLIEHPSMSVYGPRIRQNSLGIDSDQSGSSEDLVPSREEQSVLPRGSPHRPRSVAAHAGLSSNLQTVKAARVAHRRNNKQLNTRQLRRRNLVHQAGSRGVRQRRQSILMQPASRCGGNRC